MSYKQFLNKIISEGLNESKFKIPKEFKRLDIDTMEKMAVWQEFENNDNALKYFLTEIVTDEDEDYEATEDGLDEWISYEVDEVRDGNMNEYKIGNHQYLITNDYDVATQEAVAEVLDFMEEFKDQIDYEKGIYKGIRHQIINVNQEHFKEIEQESLYNYVNNIKDESSSDDDLYLNRLHEEMVEEGILEDLEDNPKIDEDDVESKIDEFVEDKLDKIDDYAEAYNTDGTLGEYVSNNPYVLDMDDEEIAEDAVKSYGVANSLASYDGNEIEQTVNGEDFYLYRTN